MYCIALFSGNLAQTILRLIMRKLSVFIFALICSLPLWSQLNASEIESALICPKDDQGSDLGYCQYTVQNLNRAQALISKVNQALFNGRPISSSDGILQPFGENEQQLLFWHNNPAILDKMKTIIPLLDTLENFTTYSIVEVRTDIYEVSESGLSSLGAEISNLKFGSLFGSDDDNGYGVTGNNNGLGVDLKIGTLELQGLISAEKSKGTLNRKGTIIRTVPNLSNLNYKDTTPIYFAPGAGTNVLQPETGIKLNGKVSINQYNNSLVNIKDYSLYYGTLTDGGFVNSVEIPFSNLILEEGVSFPIVSSKTIGTMKVKKRGLFGFGNSESIEDSKLLVYTSVKIYSFDEYINSIRALAQEPKLSFTKEEKENLDTNCVNDLDVLNDLKLIAKRDQLGDPVLSFMFDKDYACKDNFKRRVKITITGEDINKQMNTTVTTFERLMHIPLRIKEIAPRSFTQPSLTFKVKLETYGRLRSKVTLYLEFAPSVYDIEDMFWIK